MDEELMWRSFYQKIQELKSNPPTEHESRMQDTDDGFFEKFGELLRQKSCVEEEENKMCEVSRGGTGDSDSGVTMASTSGNEEDEEESQGGDATTEEPSEDCEELDCAMVPSMDHLKRDIDIDEIKERKEEFIESTVGMNIEDLYEEVLYEIINNIGHDYSNLKRETLIEYAQDVFKISNLKHEEIFAAASKKGPPNIRLNIEVIKCENLMPKDSNGFSDPFVTLYLGSNGSHRYNTSVKTETLNPTWEEHFSLPINGNPCNEVLIMEVWDFDAAESVKEKVNKLLDVKGIKGLRKLMKEIAMTASTGKHDNELIGRTAVTLKSIPVSGCTVWYHLEKGSKTKSRGSILATLTLSAEKNKQVAIQEHRHLLKLLLMYELESSQVANYWWSGKFNINAEALRSQHAVQSGLTGFDIALSQWFVYATIHEEHPLSFTLFNNTLDDIVPPLKCHLTESEYMKSFWNGAKRILPTCFMFIRKLRVKTVSDKQLVKSLCEVLDILAKIQSIPVCQSMDLFPANIYGWLPSSLPSLSTDDDGGQSFTLKTVAIQAIYSGSQEWLEHLIEDNKPSGEEDSSSSSDRHLQYLIQLVQMVRSDLQRAIEFFDRHFYYKLQFKLSSILFEFYDRKLTELIQPIVTQICSQIKRIDVPDDQFQPLPDLSATNMGTTLFELYLILKRFLTLGKSLCPGEELLLNEFHLWFTCGVTHWLDISVVKAMNRIEKAIDLDQLKAVDDSVKYSSSAVDTLSIFYQIKIFWQQLSWPDVEGSYTFVAKIVHDICRCCVFYAQRMSRRVVDLTNDNDQDLFQVTSEWCFAINNIDYIRQSLPSFIKELEIDKIIKQLAEFRTNLEAERCENTIKNVIENSLDTEKNQILELIDIMVRKMVPPMKRFLTEGAEVLHEDSNSIERLLMYLEGSLTTLHNHLNEQNFERILDAIWRELAIIMYELIQSNLAKRRPPSFFQNLRQTLNTMISCFKTEHISTSDVEILTEISRMLDMQALETAELIHQYYVEKYEYQRKMPQPKYGQLTIRGRFTDSSELLLEILNGRDLTPMDNNSGKCDSFVKVSFLPNNRFLGISGVKTAVQSKTCFPIYDEQFTIKLNGKQSNADDSIILFSLKDKDLFGVLSQYLAECCLSFADLKASDGEQIHLNLMRHELPDSDAVRALEHRQGDKQAKEFLKKLKQKASY